MKNAQLAFVFPGQGSQKVGMLADKAETGLLRQRFLQHRPRIHIPKRTRGRWAKLVDEFRQGGEPGGHDFVVISMAGVTRHPALG